jgi:regulator of sigma E protease
MAALQNVVWLLVLIGIMILVHELGHFWAARFFKVKVEVFSFGFGPRLFGFQRGDTDYRLSLLLFGGYVKFAGDQPGEAGANDPDGLLSKPRWQRLIILAAGPLMNVVLSVGLLTGMYMVHYQKIVQDGPSVVGHVDPNSAAAKAGVEKGDTITKLGGKTNPQWEDIFVVVAESPYKSLDLILSRRGRKVDTRITPQLDEKDGIGTAGWDEDGPIEALSVSAGMPAAKAGVLPGDLILSINGLPVRSRYTLLETIRQGGGKPVTLEIERNQIGSKQQRMALTMTPTFSTNDGTPRFMIGVAPELKRNILNAQLSFPAALEESASTNWKSAAMIYSFLQGMLERRMPTKNLSGPVFMAKMSGDAARKGLAEFLELMTMVSLNLAIFNLLPIPILDGGGILLLLIEMVMGREVSLTVKENILKVGFVFLMVVVVFVLYNDITKLLPQG